MTTQPLDASHAARAAHEAVEHLRLALRALLPPGDPTRGAIERLIGEARHDLTVAITAATTRAAELAEKDARHAAE